MNRAPSQSQISTFREHLPLEPDPWNLEEDSGKKPNQLPGCSGVRWAGKNTLSSCIIQYDFIKYSLCCFHQSVCHNINYLGCLSATTCTQPISSLPVHILQRQIKPTSRCSLLLKSFHLPITCLLITQISETTSQNLGRFLPQAFALQVNIQTLSPDNRLTFSVFTRCQAFFCASPCANSFKP